MATKPELIRAVPNTKIKAAVYNKNNNDILGYIEGSIAGNAINNYEADREYSEGQWVLANVNGENGIYESQVDGNKGQSLNDEVYWKNVFTSGELDDISGELDNISGELGNKTNLDLSNSTPTANFATLLNNVGIRTVVEIYSNGKSWYRKYSDGWVEQGGVITGLKDTEFTPVTFLVPIQEPTAGFMAQMTGGTVMSGTNVVAAIGYIPNNTTLMLAISDYGSFSNICYWVAWGVMA